MNDNILASDEVRRATQHEAIKTKVESDVNAEIAARVDRTANTTAKRINEVAGEFRDKAVDEVVETEHEVWRARGLARVSQVVDYIFYVIYALLAMRLLLTLIAARSSAGFVQFIHEITNPLYSPFRGMVASPTIEGHTLAVPLIVAILVYALVHAGIYGLLRLLVHRKTEI